MGLLVAIVLMAGCNAPAPSPAAATGPAVDLAWESCIGRGVRFYFDRDSLVPPMPEGFEPAASLTGSLTAGAFEGYECGGEPEPFTIAWGRFEVVPPEHLADPSIGSYWMTDGVFTDDEALASALFVRGMGPAVAESSVSIEESSSGQLRTGTLDIEGQDLQARWAATDEARPASLDLRLFLVDANEFPSTYLGYLDLHGTDGTEGTGEAVMQPPFAVVPAAPSAVIASFGSLRVAFEDPYRHP